MKPTITFSGAGPCPACGGAAVAVRYEPTPDHACTAAASRAEGEGTRTVCPKCNDPTCHYAVHGYCKTHGYEAAPATVTNTVGVILDVARYNALLSLADSWGGTGPHVHWMPSEFAAALRRVLTPLAAPPASRDGRPPLPVRTSRHLSGDALRDAMERHSPRPSAEDYEGECASRDGQGGDAHERRTRGERDVSEHNHHPDEECGEHCPSRESAALRSALAASEAALAEALRETYCGCEHHRPGSSARARWDEDGCCQICGVDVDPWTIRALQAEARAERAEEALRGLEYRGEAGCFCDHAAEPCPRCARVRAVLALAAQDEEGGL